MVSVEEGETRRDDEVNVIYGVWIGEQAIRLCRDE